MIAPRPPILGGAHEPAVGRELDAVFLCALPWLTGGRANKGSTRLDIYLDAT